MLTRLTALPDLKLFTKIVKKLLVAVRLETKVRIEILSKATMERLTERVCEELSEGEVGERAGVGEGETERRVREYASK